MKSLLIARLLISYQLIAYITCSAPLVRFASRQDKLYTDKQDNLGTFASFSNAESCLYPGTGDPFLGVNPLLVGLPVGPNPTANPVSSQVLERMNGM